MIMGLFGRRKPGGEQPPVGPIPDTQTLVDVGYRAYGPEGVGSLPDLVDPPVVAMYEAHSFPSPGTPQYNAMVDDFFNGLADVVGDDEWSRIGALLLARNLITDDYETHPVFLQLMKGAVSAFKQTNVDPMNIPPYIMRHW